MHGFDQFVARPPLSVLFSLLLIVGFDAIGLTALRALRFAHPDAPRWQRFQAPIVGGMLCGIVLQPLALAGLTPLALLQGTAIVCVATGLPTIWRATCRLLGRRGDTESWTHTAASWLRGWNLFFVLLFVGAGLMALGPVTDADSLDYHIGVPLALLKAGGMPVTPEWFTSRMAGMGEVLNALGLSIGAEQLGTLLQYAGLGSVAMLLLFAENDKTDDGAGSPDTRPLVACAALATPVCVSIISPKPQLWPVSMTTLALALVLYPSRRRLNSRDALVSHALVCLLVMSASQTKLTYTLGGGVVGLLSLIMMARRRLFLPALGIGCASALVIVAPPVVFKYHYFHAGLMESFIKLMPGDWPGTEKFTSVLKGYVDSSVPFPLSLILPSGPGTASTTLGAGLILLIALRPGRDAWQWTGVGAALVVALLAVVMGPTTSRSYLEPLFWLLMVLALGAPGALVRGGRWFTWPVRGQALLTGALYWYGGLTLAPGAVTPTWRRAVMRRAAYSYSVMQWADSVLPRDAVLLSGYRSMALVPRDAVSFGWSNFVVPGSVASDPYLARLKERSVTHMLVQGEPPEFHNLGGCVGRMLAEPYSGRLATRNPFNAAFDKARIFEFNSRALPECARLTK